MPVSSTLKMLIAEDRTVQLVKKFFGLSDTAMEREIEEAKNPKFPLDIEMALKTPEGIRREINYNPYSPIKTALHSFFMKIVIQQRIDEHQRLLAWIKQMMEKHTIAERKKIAKPLLQFYDAFMQEFEKAKGYAEKAEEITRQLKRLENQLYQAITEFFIQLKNIDQNVRTVFEELSWKWDEEKLMRNLPIIQNLVVQIVGRNVRITELTTMLSDSSLPAVERTNLTSEHRVLTQLNTRSRDQLEKIHIDIIKGTAQDKVISEASRIQLRASIEKEIIQPMQQKRLPITETLKAIQSLRDTAKQVLPPMDLSKKQRELSAMFNRLKQPSPSSLSPPFNPPANSGSGSSPRAF